MRTARLVAALLLGALGSAGLLRAGEDQAKAPSIRVEPEGFDFGKALPQKTLRKEFVLRNFGDAELVIENVSTTCGCAAALTSDNRVPPGGSTQLAVTLETRSYSGRVERQVLVRSNDPKTPLLTVKVSATVAKPAAK